MKYGDIKILILRSSCIILDDSTYRRIRRGEQRDIIFKMASEGGGRLNSARSYVSAEFDYFGKIGGARRFFDFRMTNSLQPHLRCAYGRETVRRKNLCVTAPRNQAPLKKYFELGHFQNHAKQIPPFASWINYAETGTVVLPLSPPSFIFYLFPFLSLFLPSFLPSFRSFLPSFLFSNSKPADPPSGVDAFRKARNTAEFPCRISIHLKKTDQGPLDISSDVVLPAEKERNTQRFSSSIFQVATFF